MPDTAVARILRRGGTSDDLRRDLRDHRDPEAARSFAARFFGVPADAVTTVGEDYEREAWAGPRFVPADPGEDAAAILDRCVLAVDDEKDRDTAVRAAYRALAGDELPHGDWSSALHAALSRNELVFRLNDELGAPRALAELSPALERHLGRPVAEAEILAWLALGAAATTHDRPLLRPVVHGFVRGIGGAVATFPEDHDGPKLWLAAEDKEAGPEPSDSHAHFPVTTCTTCGQHYFITFLEDFSFTRKNPGGGRAGPTGSWWPALEQTEGGKRAVLIDKLIGEGDDDDTARQHTRTARLHFCRRCGAAHPDSVTRMRSRR